MSIIDRKGLTLVEVLLSIAILAILTIALLPLFTTALKGIITAGNNSDEIYQSQNGAEDKVLQGASSTANTMTIIFSDTIPIIVTMNGEDFIEGNIKVFVPE
jgi:prepilin-type N-terminal cleavage/methylation domain-containing protein